VCKDSDDNIFLECADAARADYLIKAVSQLLWPDKDREEWFSVGENHAGRRGFGLHQLRNRSSGNQKHFPKFWKKTKIITSR
jgi:hypothetical protein